MTNNKQVERARKGVFVVLAEAGIKSRDDRLELAEDILKKRINSFTELSDDDYLDLHFALQAWKVIQDVRSANGALLEESSFIVENRFDISLSDYEKTVAAPLPYQEEEID